ncbi:hypothetical protein MRB53_017110 [Persea americana]|uniref:Uncharacterized protein n=1 Tax=Persea americana TaxID=3435 RepID=A0ACC2M504_PERAE|nr:hypothetical protein MRB53_017110 [Persea americana]
MKENPKNSRRGDEDLSTPAIGRAERGSELEMSIEGRRTQRAGERMRSQAAISQLRALSLLLPLSSEKFVTLF